MNTEIIHHFVCTFCKGWWSIAFEEFIEHSTWFCPWCGEENDLRGVIRDNGKEDIMPRGKGTYGKKEEDRLKRNEPSKGAK